MNEFLILYILRLGNFNIYEIKKYIDVSFSPFIEVSVGAIIPALNRLEITECVTKQKLISDGGLRRTVYSMTEKGEAEFNTYLEKDIDGAPQLLRRETEVLLSLIDNPNLSEEQNKLLKQKIESALSSQIKRIKSAISSGKFNLEFLNMELIYTEAKQRLLKDDDKSIS